VTKGPEGDRDFVLFLMDERGYILSIEIEDGEVKFEKSILDSDANIARRARRMIDKMMNLRSTGKDDIIQKLQDYIQLRDAFSETN
jgi:hypothetical protein